MNKPDHPSRPPRNTTGRRVDRAFNPKELRIWIDVHQLRPESLHSDIAAILDALSAELVRDRAEHYRVFPLVNFAGTRCGHANFV